MHILVLSDTFYPESTAAAARTLEHAKEWVAQGQQVTVVTSVPNFPEGKVFNGYQNKWYQCEELEGIRVVRVKTYMTANEGTAKRILDFISFMITGFLGSLLQKKVDVVLATSPQFFTACAGWAVGAFKRVPFIFEVRDIWPASIKAVGAMKPSKFLTLLEKVEMFLYRRADMIVPVTHAFKDELVQRGVDAAKINVVRNGVDLSRYRPAAKKSKALSQQYQLQDKFIVGYVGTHGVSQKLETIIEVAESLQKQAHIHFIFAGTGAEKNKLITLAKTKGLANVTFLDKQPKENMPHVWSLCDISLVPLKDTELFETVIPSKIFECIGMGIPMIASIPQGEAAEIIAEYEVGLITPPETSDAIKQAILELYHDTDRLQKIKKNCETHASKFSRQVLAQNLLSYLKTLR